MGYITMAAASLKIETTDPRNDSFDVRAVRVAAVAAQFSAAVDRDARFPAETFAALKAEKLLSMMIPAALGGEGADPGAVMEVCYRLGQVCSSSALIFAMHQVKVFCVVRHAHNSIWHADFMRRIVAHELLLASSTTEGNGGGDVRSSAGAVVYQGSNISLVRDATVMSYGAQADAIVTTARRSPEAAPSDQVLIAFEKADYTLDPTTTWDTLGMRGTSSAGFNFKAEGVEHQILPEAYASIHSVSMVPSAHLMWSSVWAGIAAGAVEKARLFTRKAARGAGGQLPPGAIHFTRASAQLRQLRALLTANLARFDALADDHAALQATDFQTAIAMLKVEASELAVATVMSAMRATGLSGYRNDTDVSIGRSLRDILSSPIMINNERIVANLAASVMLSETPSSFRD